MTLSREEWRRLLDSVDLPTYGEVVVALRDARDLSDSRARELVDTALEQGPLAERDTEANFSKIALKADQNTETEGVSPGVTPGVDAVKPGSSEWSQVDFTNIQSGTYPPELLEREQWMGRLEDSKLPFAPWGDRDHPEADPDKDARYKWGLEENYVDGETVAIAEEDPRLDGRIFIQRETDPIAFVDGDGVICPETGEAHPGFIRIIARLGMTYVDRSTSHTGAHGYYIGELPDDMGQAVFEIDTEPWGANDDLPTVEIYANKHVCVTTGDHLADTPLEVREWDQDALEAVLEEHDALEEPDPTHDSDRDRADLEDYDADATDSDETTTEIKDVLKAVDRLSPHDLRLDTQQVGTDSTGWGKYDPSTYRTSSGNDSLHYNGEGAFYDHKTGKSFGVLGLLAAEENIITNPWDRLAGSDWWEAVETAREQGASIPEYVGAKEADTEPVAVLPPGVRDLRTPSLEYDSRHVDGEDHDALSMEDARKRTVDTIAEAYNRNETALIEALPTMGKSYGSIEAAAETDTQICVFTTRGNKEQYSQFAAWCEKHGLTYNILPSFKRDCPTASGEHGEEWAEQVNDWYNRGATPQAIHANAEYELGEPLPCQEHDGQECPYTSAWRTAYEDPNGEEYDVLIGHYYHAYNQKVTESRVCVFDEFPSAFETTLYGQLQGAITYWLQQTEAIPFEDYTDLIENRDDDRRRADALLWFEEHDLDTDETGVFNDPQAHAIGPVAVCTILRGEDLGNGFEHATLDDFGIGVFDRETHEVSILQPPAIDYASGVIALDGTPTKEMWDLALGENLTHREVLTTQERAEYIKTALDLNIVRTTKAVKPYNSSDHVNTDRDAALLERIQAEHGDKPALITTTTAEIEYAHTDILEMDDDDNCIGGLVDAVKHYGNILGSNEFKQTRLGAVIGSNHYGDQYIQRWGAYAGEYVPGGDEARESEKEKGAELSYGGFGDRVLTHMREHDTLQAAMRFGRDGNGAVVYVHTDTLPEWVPIAAEGRVVNTWSDGMKQVVRTIEDLGAATTAEITEQVTVGTRQVQKHLNTLRERGVLEREQHTEDGRKVLWRDGGVHRVNDHGDVDLDPVELDELSQSEVDELARNSNYTWEFVNLPGDSDVTGWELSSLSSGGPIQQSNRGDWDSIESD